MWLGQNSFRIIEGLCAAAKIGGVFCPANWRQSAAEFEFVITDVDPKVVINQAAEIGAITQTARDTIVSGPGSTARWLLHDAEGDSSVDSYEAFLAGHPTDAPGLIIDPGSSVLMLYTAAFTGTPNGALLSHTAILVQDLVMPPIGLALGKVNMSDLFVNLSDKPVHSLAEAKAAGAATINYGVFLNTIIEFLIIAFFVFLIVKAVTRLHPASVTTKACPMCAETIPVVAKRCGHCTSDLTMAKI